DLGLRIEPHRIEVARGGLAHYDDVLSAALLRAAARRSGLVLGVRRARQLGELTRRPSGRRLPLGAGWVAAVAVDRLRVTRAATGPATRWSRAAKPFCGCPESAGVLTISRGPEPGRYGWMLPSTASLKQTGGRELKRIVFDEETIARRVGELGQEITAAYPDGELLVLGLLKGSFIFLSDLVRRI